MFKKLARTDGLRVPANDPAESASIVEKRDIVDESAVERDRNAEFKKLVEEDGVGKSIDEPERSGE